MEIWKWSKESEKSPWPPTDLSAQEVDGKEGIFRRQVRDESPQTGRFMTIGFNKRTYKFNDTLNTVMEKILFTKIECFWLLLFRDSWYVSFNFFLLLRVSFFFAVL